jgi:hypothetical protein
LWVAGGYGRGQKIATSSDGVSWTGSTSGDALFTGGYCQAVAYNGIAGASGLWVAGGSGIDHKIATSSDGISWTGSTSGDLAFAGGTCLAVAYGNGLWVAGGDYSSAHNIAYSSDGISWTGSASGDLAFAGGACKAVAYNAQDGLWVFGGYGDIIPPEPPEPTPIVAPPVFFQQQVISSFNIFQTNFSGMGNLGEYY